MKKKTKLKHKKVTRKFLNELANKIYDPKTKKYLRLCRGVLTNGPDPVNKDRTMHCGLGELYFAMTGKNAQEGVREIDVINTALARTSLRETAANNFKEARKLIAKLPASQEVCQFMDQYLFDYMEEFNHEEEFQDILESIPSINDAVKPAYSCKKGPRFDNSKIFRDRSRLVAAAFRKAAKLLPE